ncbi:CBS domain-containing protein [Bacillus sp. Bva_UNVM-123]|uniref:CBS domain-containing protein n=1 Tax=Bacillus sp. Bva_UNVM-123 TaxID=2829798 RepID=UPI00391FAD47
MKVKEFMLENVIKASPNSTIKEVMEIFVVRKIGGLPICDSDGTLLGVVSDGDILRAIKPIDRKIYSFLFYMEYLEARDLKERLEDITETAIINIAKKKGIVTVSPDDDIESVVTLLSKHHFKKLPVIDENNRVIGVISRGDVLRKIQASILNKL